MDCTSPERRHILRETTSIIPSSYFKLWILPSGIMPVNQMEAVELNWGANFDFSLVNAGM